VTPGSPSPLAGEGLDPARMRRERLDTLQRGMAGAGIDALVLLGLSNVQYAVGTHHVAGDQSHAFSPRIAAVVPASGAPHLCTPWPDGAPPELPVEHVHPALDLDTDGGAADLFRLADDVSGRDATVAFDEHTTATWFRTNGTARDAMPILGAAKLQKTGDELECIRRAQAINEAAMDDVRPLARPGTAQTELTAAFQRRVNELAAGDGARVTNAIDPIWQVVAPMIEEGPWTTTGHVAYPLSTTERVLADGDVIWVDTGITYLGYASDFGRTWVVGDPPRPTPRQVDQFHRWLDVVDRVRDVIRPGATAADLTRAARHGERTTPWLPHFYLAHGVGTDSAEMPLVGTDLGEAFDEGFVLAPGMVLVLEPVIWDDGHAGYRSEEIVAVSDDGWVPLSDHTYAPFG
jgi:Xaa-Pro aminopeptidase